MMPLTYLNTFMKNLITKSNEFNNSFELKCMRNRLPVIDESCLEDFNKQNSSTNVSDNKSSNLLEIVV